MAFLKRIGCLLNLLFRPSGALRVMLDGHRCLTAPAMVMPALRAWSTVGVQNLGHTSNPNAKPNLSDAVSEGWEVRRGRHVLGSHLVGET